MARAMIWLAFCGLILSAGITWGQNTPPSWRPRIRFGRTIRPLTETSRRINRINTPGNRYSAAQPNNTPDNRYPAGAPVGVTATTAISRAITPRTTAISRATIRSIVTIRRPIGAAARSAVNRRTRRSNAVFPLERAQTPPPPPPFVLTPAELAQIDQVLKTWEQKSKEVKTFDAKFVRWSTI